MLPHPRRRLRALIAALCAVAALVPLASTPAGAQSRERLREIEQTKRRAEEALQGLERSENAKVAQLQEADARRAALQEQLDALSTELSGAQGELDEAEVALAETTQQRTQTQGELDQAREDLSENREDFSRRVRAAYIYGRPDPTSALPSVTDAGTAGRAIGYLERVAQSEQEAVEEVAALSTQIDSDVAELARIQDRRRAAEEVAASERDRVAGLVDEQRTVTAAAEEEAEAHEAALDEILADEQAHQSLIASLEAESLTIEEQLRSAAAAAAAARAAREAEEQRVAVAAAAAAAAQGSRSSGSSVSSAPAPAAPAPAPAPDDSGGGLYRPVNGPQTSGYGYRRHPIYGSSRLHTGIDFSGGCGTPIYAADSGVVSSTGWRGGYGNATVLVHPSGIATLYGHQSRFAVSGGASVSRGQLIGYVGTTGASTGCHLHFEVRVNGRPVNPAGYL